MGRIDKSDQLIHFYRTFIKSKKWFLRLITHTFDLVASNNYYELFISNNCTNYSWLQYKKEAIELSVPKKKILDLLHFCLQLADELIRFTRKIAIAKKNKVRRPPKLTYSSPNINTASTSFSHLPSYSPSTSSLSSIYSLNQTKSRTDSPIVSDAVRYGQIDHMPQMDNMKNAKKCKNPCIQIISLLNVTTHDKGYFRFGLSPYNQRVDFSSEILTSQLIKFTYKLLLVFLFFFFGLSSPVSKFYLNPSNTSH